MQPGTTFLDVCSVGQGELVADIMAQLGGKAVGPCYASQWALYSTCRAVRTSQAVNKRISSLNIDVRNFDSSAGPQQSGLDYPRYAAPPTTVLLQGPKQGEAFPAIPPALHHAIARNSQLLQNVTKLALPCWSATPMDNELALLLYATMPNLQHIIIAEVCSRPSFFQYLHMLPQLHTVQVHNSSVAFGRDANDGQPQPFVQCAGLLEYATQLTKLAITDARDGLLGQPPPPPPPPQQQQQQSSTPPPTILHCIAPLVHLAHLELGGCNSSVVAAGMPCLASLTGLQHLALSDLCDQQGLAEPDAQQQPPVLLQLAPLQHLTRLTHLEISAAWLVRGPTVQGLEAIAWEGNQLQSLVFDNVDLLPAYDQQQQSPQQHQQQQQQHLLHGNQQPATTQLHWPALRRLHLGMFCPVSASTLAALQLAGSNWGSVPPIAHLGGIKLYESGPAAGEGVVASSQVIQQAVQGLRKLGVEQLGVNVWGMEQVSHLAPLAGTVWGLTLQQHRPTAADQHQQPTSTKCSWQLHVLSQADVQLLAQVLPSLTNLSLHGFTLGFDGGPVAKALFESCPKLQVLQLWNVLHNEYTAVAFANDMMQLMTCKFQAPSQCRVVIRGAGDKKAAF